jgi:hypothetical protein
LLRLQENGIEIFRDFEKSQKTKIFKSFSVCGLRYESVDEMVAEIFYPHVDIAFSNFTDELLSDSNSTDYSVKLMFMRARSMSLSVI